MIRAYDQSYLDDVLDNVGYMFDVAVNFYHLNINSFANLFKESEVAKGIEERSPLYLCGKSPLELLSIVLEKEDIPRMFFSSEKSPEYWVGYIYAYANWRLMKSFSTLIDIVSPQKLLSLYHPYHEASEEKAMELFRIEIDKETVIKSLREKNGLSQVELSILTGIPVRTIRAYEKDNSSLLKAGGENLYNLSKALKVTMEYLIKHSI